VPRVEVGFIGKEGGVEFTGLGVFYKETINLINKLNPLSRGEVIVHIFNTVKVKR